MFTLQTKNNFDIMSVFTHLEFFVIANGLNNEKVEGIVMQVWIKQLLLNKSCEQRWEGRKIELWGNRIMGGEGHFCYRSGQFLCISARTLNST